MRQARGKFSSRQRIQIEPAGADMDLAVPPQYFELYFEGGDWKILWCQSAYDAKYLDESQSPGPIVVGPATGPRGITEAEAERLAWKMLLTSIQRSQLEQQTTMTLSSYVETKFVPEHVALKMRSSQTHYQRMLKHILTPADVDRAFGSTAKGPGGKLESVPGWPYLGSLRLCDVRPEHIRGITSAAIQRGYSTHTVKHIRNAMSAIFSHARQGQYFAGENPVSQARLADQPRKEAPALTLAEVEAAFRSMKHPEKEMMLMAILADINMSEICGLQWKRVNLNATESDADGDPIPPRTIAVRKQWYRDRLEDLKPSRVRTLSIPPPLLPVLVKLRNRARFSEPDDFVFVSRQGTPVNQNNIVERRLKPLAVQLGAPSLSWQVFRRTRKILLAKLGDQFPKIMATMVRDIYS
jgi:integrase